MNSNFDTLWEGQALHQVGCCPLSPDQMERAIARAMENQPTTAPLTVANNRSVRRWVLPLGVAAALAAAIVIPSTGRAKGLDSIQYAGQEVRFVCNNQCQAESVLSSFDDYLQRV